jgi:hypothetical protein
MLQQHEPPPKGGCFVLLTGQRRFARNRYQVTEHAACGNFVLTRALNVRSRHFRESLMGRAHTDSRTKIIC